MHLLEDDWVESNREIKNDSKADAAKEKSNEDLSEETSSSWFDYCKIVRWKNSVLFVWRDEIVFYFHTNRQNKASTIILKL